MKPPRFLTFDLRGYNIIGKVISLHSVWLLERVWLLFGVPLLRGFIVHLVPGSNIIQQTIWGGGGGGGGGGIIFLPVVLMTVIMFSIAHVKHFGTD